MDDTVVLVSQTLFDGSIGYVDSSGVIWEPRLSSLQLSSHPKLHMADISFESWSDVINTDLTASTTLFYLFFSLICVIVGGISSGLNISLLSIDEQKFSLLLKSNDKKIVEMCNKIQPLLKDHHLLLVTILLINAVAMEVLPLLLDDLVAPWLAVIISVTFIFIFGEILPQAIFSARDAIEVSAKFATLVIIFEYLFYIIAKPIAWSLDLFIKKENIATLYTRKEMSKIIDIIQDFSHPDQKTLIRM